MKLSAFADEMSLKLNDQISFLKAQNVNFIELRFVDDVNVMDLKPDQVRDIKARLEDAGIGLSALGSPIGKVRLDEPFEPHLDRFKHAVDLAQTFATSMIRVFSYYPPEGKNIDDFRDQVLDRMAAKLDYLNGTNLILAHENESHIYGYSAEHCADMAKTLNHPQFRLVFDPGNFVWGQDITNCVETCWPLMKPYLCHVHIKDWKLGAKIGAMPGEGDGQVPELFSELAAMSYDGFVTMEPHLEIGGQFGGHTGPKLYEQAIAAVRRLSDKAGCAMVS